MHVVTAGYKFIDIDAYASAVALAELLRLQGKEAIAASSAPFNASIPQSLRDLNVQFEKQYEPAAGDTFSLVDVSDPEHFDFHIRPEQVTQVIDHHQGFETFWKEKIGTNAWIERIGAACTLVYELWHNAGLTDKMSRESARLLACGILDNTLNLKAKITIERDKTAYAALLKRAELPDDFAASYLGECQQFTLDNIQEALQNDTKPIDYPSLSHTTVVGQLALWDAGDFINSSREIIRSFLSTDNLPWCMNLIDIHSGKSVFFCEDPGLQVWLSKTLGVTFKENLATADRMWLRKEIMQQVIEGGEKP